MRFLSAVAAFGLVASAACGTPAPSARLAASGTTVLATTSTSLDGTASGQTIAPSGTAYAPPATTTKPHPSTTTTPTTPPTVPPNPGDTVTVTQDDAGKTVTLRVGQHLVVQLQAPSGQYWSSAPDTSDALVLARESTSANASSDRVTSSFTGKKAGHAQVSAAEDATCRQSTPACMTPTRLWQIQVDVI